MPAVTLHALVAAERKRLGLSVRGVAERSGGLLSSTTVADIEKGKRDSFTEETLEGFAAAFEVPIDQIRKAAGVARPDVDEPFVLPRRANRLSRRERQVVLDMVDALLEAKRRS